MKTIDEFINEEDARLSRFAVKNTEAQERIYPEENHPYRLSLHRDRDRIYHSRAFKRLEYKTQVFINSEGDNFRTRLTHTLEVAGVARTVATALGLNPHLSEVIALAHDLGHTPFGHAGQDKMSELMRGYGGFEHNKQSLRIVQTLENRYIQFPGLNLSVVTLVGLMKHGAEYYNSTLGEIRKNNPPILEALVADVSDEIAYTHHDIEDGLEKGLLTVNQMMNVPFWEEFYTPVKQEFSKVSEELIIRQTLRRMMNHAVTDLIMNTEKSLKDYSNREDLSGKDKDSIVSYSKELKPRIMEMKKFLLEKLYKHPQVLEKSNKGQEIIESLFYYLLKNQSKIPQNYLIRSENEGLERAIADYISGMTDRYAESKWKEFGLG
ncbi:MAG: deoxyguanosinetriphosphate triphosphohydrolase [Leptospiraceae bacterium]|nr:deoxyguanosinetriphosphate triphosphohydrolase [Leptospiraceae bacterium]